MGKRKDIAVRAPADRAEWLRMRLLSWPDAAPSEAEDWARAKGFTEIGSDALPGNDVSIAAHQALGFEAVERLVTFAKKLWLPSLFKRGFSRVRGYLPVEPNPPSPRSVSSSSATSAKSA